MSAENGELAPDLDPKSLVQELARSETSDLAHLGVRELALKLSGKPGFDTLLAPDVAREVELFDYQLNAVRRVLQDMRGRALLCDEVGLGKTIELAGGPKSKSSRT